ncbi:hypothetical protein, partial [Kushneria phyllosphaerae]|uniref:hypothetical protein n=1 Tax=Kushneria phyllosphaerae TaxID=2100822 RepID=UPI001A9C7583
SEVSGWIRDPDWVTKTSVKTITCLPSPLPRRRVLRGSGCVLYTSDPEGATPFAKNFHFSVTTGNASTDNRDFR